MKLLPVMLPGFPGALPGTIVRVCGMDVPQEEVAMTEIVPDAVPGEDGITVMEFVVEKPVQPGGRVQEYEEPVAKVTE